MTASNIYDLNGIIRRSIPFLPIKRSNISVWQEKMPAPSQENSNHFFLSIGFAEKKRQKLGLSLSRPDPGYFCNRSVIKSLRPDNSREPQFFSAEAPRALNRRAFFSIFQRIRNLPQLPQFNAVVGCCVRCRFPLLALVTAENMIYNNAKGGCVSRGLGREYRFPP